MAARAWSVCPENQRADPSSSHAHRVCATTVAGQRRGRERLFSTITRRAYSAAAVRASISADPGTFEARSRRAEGAST